MIRQALIAAAVGMLGLVSADPAAAAAKVYWSDNGLDQLARANPVAGATPEVILQFDPTYVPSPAGIDIDPAARKIYWAERSYPDPSIWRANLDGSDPQMVVNLNTAGYSTAQPHGLALDWQRQMIYWTDTVLKRIFRAKYDGTELAMVPNVTLDTSYGLAVDSVRGKLYWTDWGNHAIYRADLGGSNIETLLGPDYYNLRDVAGIDLDLTNGWMYWANQNSRKIQAAAISNPAGTLTTIFYTPQNFLPRDVAVDAAEGKIYWVDIAQARIQRADLDGSNVETLVVRTRPPDPILLSIALDPVPEPASLAIFTVFGAMAAGLAGLRSRRRPASREWLGLERSGGTGVRP